MKLKTVLVAATAGGIGYVLGTKAGRARFEQIRGQAQEFLKSPTVQDTVANLSDTVKQNAAKLPDPVANVVTAVADQVKGSTAKDSSGTDSSATDFTTTDSTDAGATLSDTPVTEYPATGGTFTDPTVPQSPPPSSQQ
jgi:hypothetical protein